LASWMISLRHVGVRGMLGMVSVRAAYMMSALHRSVLVDAQYS
jgi:hypothetical protein